MSAYCLTFMKGLCALTISGLSPLFLDNLKSKPCKNLIPGFLNVSSEQQNIPRKYVKAALQGIFLKDPDFKYWD